MAQNAQRPVGKLAVGNTQVHHQILIDSSGAYHCTGGKHIKNHLGGGAGFQTCGPHEYLWSGGRLNGQISVPGQFRMLITGQRNCQCSNAAGIVQRSHAIRGVAAGADGDHHIIPADSRLFQVLLSLGVVVLRTLHSIAQRDISPRDDSLYHRAGNTKRGRAFGCIQHAQPPASSRAGIKQPSPAGKAGGDFVDYAADDRHGLRHGLHHPLVLAVHQSCDLLTIHRFQRSAFSVDLLCTQLR